MTGSGNGTTDDRSRRAAALRALALEAPSRLPGAPPSPALVEALRVFGTERDLVLTVHQRWQVSLLARLDQVLECGGHDPHAEVSRAVDELGRALPGFAALLLDHADDPVLDVARRRLAAYVQLACPCGRGHRLVAPARPARAAAGCAVLQAFAATARSVRRLAERGAGPRLRSSDVFGALLGTPPPAAGPSPARRTVGA